MFAMTLHCNVHLAMFWMAMVRSCDLSSPLNRNCAVHLIDFLHTLFGGGHAFLPRKAMGCKWTTKECYSREEMMARVDAKPGATLDTDFQISTYADTQLGGLTSMCWCCSTATGSPKDCPPPIPPLFAHLAAIACLLGPEDTWDIKMDQARSVDDKLGAAQVRKLVHGRLIGNSFL